MKRVILIDFYDSFSYNIVAELYSLGLKVEVVHIDKLSDVMSGLQSSKDRIAVVYGPGPGHPSDYQVHFESISTLLKNENLYHVGICLGHQILWSVMNGGEIHYSKKPIHGGSVDLLIPPWREFPKSEWNRKVRVQRYNSLALKMMDSVSKSNYVLTEEEDSLMCRFLGGITYQFHPESVGTSYPSLFFAPILKFLYNS